jgi:hypothetical protein
MSALHRPGRSLTMISVVVAAACAGRSVSDSRENDDGARAGTGGQSTGSLGPGEPADVGGGESCLTWFPQPFARVACTALPECIDPSAPVSEMVSINRPAPTPGNEKGAGGESGAPGDPGEAGASALEIDVCDVPLQSPFRAYLAYNTFHPSSGRATHAFVRSDGTCAGQAVREIVLDEFDPPAPGTWTTQCVPWNPRMAPTLLLAAREPGVRFANPRFVSGCECPRDPKMWTICGEHYESGASEGSTCAPR